METFTTFRAMGVPIDIPNCDTDQLIPARFLRHLPSDGGYERYLFHDLRYTSDGAERPEFILNQSPYRDARIVVGDVNWGCGSSRENAVYALQANGIRSVIAPSFGDIHYNNCLKYGLLPIVADREVCDRWRAALHAQPGSEIAIDLAAQTVAGPDGQSVSFEIGAFDKHRLLNGLDEIGVTLEYRDRIDAFEAEHFEDYRWMSR